MRPSNAALPPSHSTTVAEPRPRCPRAHWAASTEVERRWARSHRIARARLLHRTTPLDARARTSRPPGAGPAPPAPARAAITLRRPGRPRPLLAARRRPMGPLLDPGRASSTSPSRPTTTSTPGRRPPTPCPSCRRGRRGAAPGHRACCPGPVGSSSTSPPAPPPRPASASAPPPRRQPTGPFASPAPRPLVCQPELGGSIDPHPFVDDDGTAYLTWKADGNAIGGTSQLFAQRLGHDGLTLEGDAIPLLRNDAAWETPLIENPALVRLEGRYVLLYSGGWWESDGYATGYATCDSPLGPCTKVTTERPLHASDHEVAGPGGACTSPAPAGDMWLAHHGWTPGRRLWSRRRPQLALRFPGMGRCSAGGPPPLTRSSRAVAVETTEASVVGSAVLAGSSGAGSTAAAPSAEASAGTRACSSSSGPHRGPSPPRPPRRASARRR